MTDARVVYAERTAAGWTSSLAVPRIDYKFEIYTGYGDGDPDPQSSTPIEGRINSPISSDPPDPEFPELFYIKRLHVQLPDGSTHELRASDQRYSCDSATFGCTATDLTGTFYSVDGSRMRLEAGLAESTLFLPDGSRYLFGPRTESEPGHLANALIDRNGNKMLYDAATKQWTDTIGRIIKDPMPLNWIGAQHQTVEDVTATFPGLAGATTNVVLSWRYLKDPNGGESGLNDPSQTLGYLSRIYCQGNLAHDVNDIYLFGGGGEGVRVCGPGFTSAGPRFNPVVLTKITFQNGQSYQFRYNIFGEIEKIIYPTGAYERFAYEGIPTLREGFAAYDQANRGVVDRWLSSTGSEADEVHWSYAAVRAADYRVSIFAPDGTVTEQRLFHETRGNFDFFVPSPYGYSEERIGRTYDDRIYATGNQLLRRKLIGYVETSELMGHIPDIAATRDLRQSKEISIIFEPGSTSALATMTETVYEVPGQNGAPTDPAYFAALNPKQTKTYGYVVVNAATAENADIISASAWFSGSGPTTVTDRDYLYDANYTARGIPSRPGESRVLNPSNPNDILAKTQLLYDETLYFDNNYTTSNWVDPASNLRGNVTTTRGWVKETDTWVESHTMYDNFGNVRKVWDTSGDATKFVETQYDPLYKYAYPTKSIAPAPDPANTHGTSATSTVETTYDFTTGLPLTVKDNFGQITRMEYDTFLRPIRIYAENFVAPETQTVYGVPDANGQLPPDQRFIKVRKQLDATNWDEATSWTDGLGRTIKTQAKDSQGDVYVDTHYDNMGRVDRVTSPYRIGDTVLWSKTRYDNAGRAVETYAPAEIANLGSAQSLGVTSFDISTVPNFTGTVIITTDASERKSRSIINALGQLTRVDEPTATGGTVDADLGSLASPAQPTFYTYDLYGNMVRVQQGVQSRYFLYDSLGRLLRVRQPEQEVNTALNTSQTVAGNNQWTAGFTYDVLGNVLTATDANGVTITNIYDRANRVKTRTYTMPAGQPATPNVTFYYDGKGLGGEQNPNFAKGKLTKVTSAVSETRYEQFDNFGRLTEMSQVTDGQTYTSKYTYSFSGGLIEEEYPSGRKVKNEFESDGDLLNVTSQKAGSQVYIPYVSNFSYTASGGISQMRLGNGKWETAKFNDRLQVEELGLGNGPMDASAWKVNYLYGEIDANGNVDATKNTGNIARQTLTIPGTSFVQAYKYDSLYRLTEAKEMTGMNQNWIQNWSYDRYGNRTGYTQNIAGSTSAPNPTIDANTNRFNLNQGFGYDKNGNIIVDVSPDNLPRTFVFNGDNKQTEVKKDGVTVGRYYYDGEGKRVKKVTDTETTVFVYSAGKLVAEYSTQLSQTPSVNYTTTDHLGSPRIITNQLGQVVARRDFLPFGEDIFANTGSRLATDGYSSSADNVRQKFTGYQKDNETSLDFAEARMYENRFGRFTAVDPLLASGKSANPQTFNRYIYVGNNPVVITDPSGLIWYSKYNKDTDKTEYAWFDDDPGGDWKAVFFAPGQRFIRLDNVSQGDTRLGTIYLNKYSANHLTPEEYAESMSRQATLGGACFANPQCAGLRDPVRDSASIQAMGEFSRGAPMGFTNAAKSSVDIPSMNILPMLPVDTSLKSMFNIEPWFNYAKPQAGSEQIGAFAGGFTFNIAAVLVTGKIAGGLNGSSAARNVTVGRWMSPAELEAMQQTGMVQESFSGTTHVSHPANPFAWMPKQRGSVFVEFDVPLSSVKSTQTGWGKILGPNSLEGRNAVRFGRVPPTMPPATNICPIMCRTSVP